MVRYILSSANISPNIDLDEITQKNAAKLSNKELKKKFKLKLNDFSGFLSDG